MVGFDEIPHLRWRFLPLMTRDRYQCRNCETNIEAEIESQMEIDSHLHRSNSRPEPEVVPVIEKAEEGEMVEVEPEKEEVVVAEKEVEPEPEKEEVVVAGKRS